MRAKSLIGAVITGLAHALMGSSPEPVPKADRTSPKRSPAAKTQGRRNVHAKLSMAEKMDARFQAKHRK